MGKVVPIRFNQEDVKILNETQELLGLNKAYGGQVKTIRFCIGVALSCLKNPKNVVVHLDEQNLNLFFQTRAKIEIQRKRLEKAQKVLQGDENV